MVGRLWRRLSNFKLRFLDIILETNSYLTSVLVVTLKSFFFSFFLFELEVMLNNS